MARPASDMLNLSLSLKTHKHAPCHTRRPRGTHSRLNLKRIRGRGRVHVSPSPLESKAALMLCFSVILKFARCSGDFCLCCSDALATSLLTILCSLEHRDWSLSHNNTCATFIRNPFQGATWFHKSSILLKDGLFSSTAGHTKSFTQLKVDQSAIIWATVSYRWASSAAWLSRCSELDPRSSVENQWWGKTCSEHTQAS